MGVDEDAVGAKRLSDAGFDLPRELRCAVVGDKDSEVAAGGPELGLSVEEGQGLGHCALRPGGGHRRCGIQEYPRDGLSTGPTKDAVNAVAEDDRVLVDRQSE